MCKYCNDTSSTGSPAMLKTITVSYIFKLSEFKLLPCSTILFTYTIMHFVPHLIWYPNIFCLFSAVFEPFSDRMDFFFVLNLPWQCLLYPFILHPGQYMCWMESQNLGSHNLIFSPFSDMRFFVVVALKICIQSRSH